MSRRGPFAPDGILRSYQINVAQVCVFVPLEKCELRLIWRIDWCVSGGIQNFGDVGVNSNLVGRVVADGRV